MRQKLVWGKQDIRIPGELVRAVRYPNAFVVDQFLTDHPEWVWAENLFALACRVPDYEGHGGRIPEEDKRQAERIAIIDLFLNAGCDVDIRNRRKVTALHMSCRFDLPEVASYLLRRGADPNAYDVVRETPLYRAVNLGYRDCVEVLLASDDLQINFQNRRGQTVLHRAVARGKRLIVPLLLERGAHKNLQDKSSKVPLDYARNKAIQQMLNASKH